MARIRTIKPSFFVSLSNSELPIPTRLTFVGLWTYVDDQSRGVDDPRLIKAAVWPLDEAYTSKKIQADMDLLEKAGKIRRYVVDGRNYFVVVKWHHQRIDKPQKSILPSPPGGREDSTNDPGTIREDSGNVPGMLPEDDRINPGPLPPKDGGEGKGSGREVEGKGTTSQSRLKPPDSKRADGEVNGEKENHEENRRSTAQSEPPPEPDDPVLKRLIDVWPGRNRGMECLAVLAGLRPWFADSLIDEAVGFMAEKRPASPGYLRVILVDWALQRGIYTQGDEAIQVLTKVSA